jgi:hypothetical protein
LRKENFDLKRKIERNGEQSEGHSGNAAENDTIRQIEMAMRM